MRRGPANYTAVMMASAAALLAAAPARAEFGIGINVGSLGFGVEARQTLSPSLDLRFGIAGVRYTTSFEYDNIDYDIKQSVAVPDVKLDWRPTQGKFRMTVAAGYYNQVSSLTLVPAPGGSYVIGDTRYTAAQIDSLSGKLSYHVVTPYIGVGWDFLPQGKKLGFTVDVGAYYRNKPDVWLSSTGSVSASDLQLEANNIEGDARTFAPTVKLGMLFRL
jgi:hypothetical protein